MGMSTHVVGIRDLGGQFQKMMQVKLMCEEANTSYPAEVEEYFGGYVEESEKFLLEEMETVEIEDQSFVTEWKDDMRQGFEIDVSKIPPGIKTIRFYNSC